MEVGAALVAYAEAPEPGQPSERALDHPPVPSQMGTAVHAATRDAGSDPTGSTFPAAAAVVVALVGMQLRWSLARPPTVSGPHARHRVQGRCQHHAVVAVGPAQRDAKRRAADIRDQVALRARPAAVRRVGPNLHPPFWRPGWHCPAPPDSSSGHPHPAAVPAAPGAGLPTPRLHATRQACASTSCRSSPTQSGPHAIGCPSAGGTTAGRRGSRPSAAACIA